MRVALSLSPRTEREREEREMKNTRRVCVVCVCVCVCVCDVCGDMLYRNCAAEFAHNSVLIIMMHIKV